MRDGGTLCASTVLDKRMQLKEAFGHAVRLAREEQKLTQAQLAERAGLRLSAVSHIERGTRPGKFETLEAVSRGLKTPLSTLMRRAEELIELTGKR